MFQYCLIKSFDEMCTIHSVIEKYNYIFENIPAKRKRYHLNSIRNFLLHFDEIKDNVEKKQVICLLNNYLDFILNNSNDNNKERQNDYYNFIEPVGLIYKKHASFRYFISPQFCIFISVIINIIILIVNPNILLLICFNSLSIAVIMSMYFKEHSTRVYRAGW